MNFITALNSLSLPWSLLFGFVVIWALLLMSKLILSRLDKNPRPAGEFLQVTILALNTLNSPFVAIVVMVIGMVFDIACQKVNISTDAATGVIGAGIGMLTNQASSAAAHALQQLQKQSDPNKSAPAAITTTDTSTVVVGPATTEPPKEGV